MGTADLSIADMAAAYNLPLDAVFRPGDRRRGISHQDQLAIISLVLLQKSVF